LRSRFGKSKIRVVTVKPGFVRTRMTRGMSLPRPLTAEPEQVAGKRSCRK
jgi:decaprenylphospho-beta-D-erythro-pentofuranosid-2-ulose 2-reductase